MKFLLLNCLLVCTVFLLNQVQAEEEKGVKMIVEMISNSEWANDIPKKWNEFIAVPMPDWVNDVPRMIKEIREILESYARGDITFADACVKTGEQANL